MFFVFVIKYVDRGSVYVFSSSFLWWFLGQLVEWFMSFEGINGKSEED